MNIEIDRITYTRIKEFMNESKAKDFSQTINQLLNINEEFEQIELLR
ncbi:MAG TPA: hypothetical protein VFX18_04890 [Candidatus Nitrosocosmicus sp.]|nr:hypothetical protein [Candidatus Nitrosocosmicus sp.]